MVPAPPGAKTMPPVATASSPSSRMLLEKYFAMCEANWLIGSPSFTHVGMARLSAARREPLPDPDRDLEVAGLVRGVSRRLREGPHRVVALVLGAAGEVRAEVRGLHDPEPTASDHQVAPLGERRRERDHAPVAPVGRHGPRAAHDADHRPGVLREKAGQGVVDEVVVRPLGEAFGHVRRASAVRLDVPVDAPVQRGRVIRPGVPAVHQVVARVQARGTHVVGALGVAQNILESDLAAVHRRPNPTRRRGGEQAERTPGQGTDQGPARGVHGCDARAGRAVFLASTQASTRLSRRPP